MSIGISARARFDAIRDLNTRTPRKFDPPRDESGKRLRVSEFFGVNTFDVHKMKEKLPKHLTNPMCQEIPIVSAFYGEDSGIAGGAALSSQRLAASLRM